MNIITKHTNAIPCEMPMGSIYEDSCRLTREDFHYRVERLFSMPQAEEYNYFVIYGDREHFSNIQYFTGYDPRWEESLLILGRGRKPVLLVANEGMGYVKSAPADMEVVMYQNFGLMGQPNDSRSKKLDQIFRDCGISPDCYVGLMGWKAYRKELFELKSLITDVPHYIVETLAGITGIGRIKNAIDLMADCEYGLKHSISAKEIVLFEQQGTKVSRGVYNCIKNVEPGMREAEAGELLMLNGEPLNMHPNLNFGDEHVSVGLNSPKGDTRLKLGAAFGVGYGMSGCLVHKSGMYIRSADDLPDGKKHYLEKFLKPYFACVVKWYEMMKIGTKCADVYQMVEDELGFEEFGIGLNPGHLSHTDEWTSSPFYQNSPHKIRSGMALQCDFTVSFQDPFMSAHVEDGLVIADEQLQMQVKALSTDCWERICARKKFMREVLNIELPSEVLPLSDLCGVCFPYMADPTIVLAKGED